MNVCVCVCVCGVCVCGGGAAVSTGVVLCYFLFNSECLYMYPKHYKI